MNDSLAWTSALGEAYYNQPEDVLDAVQVFARPCDGCGNSQEYSSAKG